MSSAAAPITETTAHVSGAALADELGARGLRAGAPEDGLVLDASAHTPDGWDELEQLLADAFALSQRAVAAGAPVVYVLDAPSLYGHTDPMRSMLATGLLGGMRSLAAEGMRGGVAAHAVTLDDADQLPAAADAVLWLLGARRLTGQVVHCGATHVARPAA